MGKKLTGSQKAVFIDMFNRGERTIGAWERYLPDIRYRESMNGLLQTLNNREKKGMPPLSGKRPGGGNGASTPPPLSPLPAAPPPPPPAPASSLPSEISPVGATPAVPSAHAPAAAAPVAQTSPQDRTGALKGLADFTGFIPRDAATIAATAHFDPTSVIGKWLIRRIPDGVLGEEPHPFKTADLMAKYGGGDYELTFTADGFAPAVYRIKIAGPPKPVTPTFAPPNAMAPGADRGGLRQPGPYGDLTRGLRDVDPETRIATHFETFARLQEAAERRAANRVDGQAAVGVKRAEADAAVAQSAIGVLQQAVNDIRNREGSVLEPLLKMQREDRAAAEERHRQEMERMKTEAKLEMERERERMKHETEMAEKTRAAESARQQEFWAKMQEIADRRAELERERLERMTKEHEAAIAGAQDYLEDKKKEWDEFRQREMKHLEEILSLKNSSAKGTADMEVQKLWANTIGDIAGRVERKIELVAATRGGPPNRMLPGPSGVPTAPPSSEGTPVSMADAIYKSAVFNDLFRDEICTHIRNGAPAELFVGSLFGAISVDPRANIFISYFLGRTWEQLMSEAEGRLDSNVLAIWKLPYAKTWFDQVKAGYFEELRRAREYAAQLTRQPAPAPAEPAAPAAPAAPVAAAAPAAPVVPPLAEAAARL